jgi:hypothetical protein
MDVNNAAYVKLNNQLEGQDFVCINNVIHHTINQTWHLINQFLSLLNSTLYKMKIGIKVLDIQISHM